MGKKRRLGRVARLVLKAPVLLYRWHLGALLGRRFLLVTHAGRRSGRHYQTVVEVVGHLGDRWYVMSGFGRTSDWYLNVLAAGTAQIRVGLTTATAIVRELERPQAATIVADYERRNRFMAAVIRRALSRQVGWLYTGSEADRLRLVEQLPVLEFHIVPAHARLAT
jgi:deazaflavin-dependent oxidoreductase (nitroreductase family)